MRNAATVLSFPQEKLDVAHDNAFDPIAEMQKLAQISLQESQVMANNRKARLNHHNIPKRFENKTFEDYKPTTQQAASALNTAKAYAEKFQQLKASGTCLTLYGATGTGKTHLACAIGLTLSQQGYQVIYITVADLLSQIKTSWKQGNEREVIKHYASAGLLILDEVGVQFGSETEKNYLFRVLNERYINLLPSIVMSNVDLDNLATFLGERVVSRLQEKPSVMLAFDWEDYRIIVDGESNR